MNVVDRVRGPWGWIIACVNPIIFVVEYSWEVECQGLEEVNIPVARLPGCNELFKFKLPIQIDSLGKRIKEI